MKAFKYAAYALAGLAVLLLAALALFVATFDANRWKGEIARVVAEEKGRKLHIDGDLALTLFPALGVQAEKLRLSEQGGDAPFAELDRARFTLQLRPLLRRELAVDAIELAGLRARLVRYPDGRLNIDDLLARDPAAPPLRFHIGRLKLEGARLEYRDEKSGRTLALSDLRLETEGLANAASGRLSLAARVSADAPPVEAALRLAGHYDYDAEHGRYGATGLEAAAEGEWAGTRLRLGLAGASLDPQLLRAERLTVALEAGQGAAGVSGALRSALVARLPNASVELPALSGELLARSPRLAQGSLQLAFSGALRADLGAHRAAARLAARLEDSRLQAKLDVASFSPPAFSFALDVDRLDLDRYLAPGNGARPTVGEPAPWPELQARGSVHIGRLRFGGVEAANLRLEVKASEGRLEVAPAAGASRRAPPAGEGAATPSPRPAP
jgi:AsmA protein